MRILPALIILSFIPAISNSAENETCAPYELFPKFATPVALEPGLIAIDADSIYVKKNKVYTFSGNVTVNYDGQSLKTDRIVYYPQVELIDAQKMTFYRTNDIQIKSNSINFNNKYKIINANQVEYLLPSSKISGKAQKIYRVSDVYSRLNNSTYTTCPIKQKVKDWHIIADKLYMDHSEGWGSIKRARLKIKRMPILYLPRFTFPLDERRKSGFLLPFLNYRSTSGLAAYAPWYWNIAPNKDATIIPGIISKRGFWLGTQLRYLNHRFGAKLNLEGLAKDRLLAKKDRYFVGLNLKSHLHNHLSYGIDFGKVSDKEYESDFKKTNFDENNDFVNQYGFINYRSEKWSIGAEAQAYQSLIDDKDRYRLLPRINFGLTPIRYKYLTLGLSHQYSRFDHKDNSKVTGQRHHSELKLGTNLTGNAYFIKPEITVKHTEYENLKNLSHKPEARTSTTYSLDSGLFFERELFNNSWQQTLEPRLFYVKRAKEDETSLPNFDSNAFGFSYNSLFSPNLYSGNDRLGELDRISLGITSKFIKFKNNKTHFEFRIGQGYNFNTKQASNIAVEGYINHGAWRGNIRNYLLADTYKLETQETSIHYQPNNKLHLKASYKFKDNLHQELDLAGAWQLNPKWLVYARGRHSLLSGQERAIENLVGFTYDSCCWAVNLDFKRELKADGTDEYDDSINLSLELKGLTSKHDTDKTLKNIFE